MRLFVLRLGDKHGDYGCALGFVVRAEDKDDARGLASQECGDEGPKIWLNEKKTSCDPLPVKGKPSVILRDFNAG